MLERGADVNALRSDHFTTLPFAARDGKVEVVRVLPEHGVELGVETKDSETALKLARNTEIEKLLLEYGAR